ncbi:MAG: hypothetical protein Athens101428_485, partial [Candidatus Berkelbacteria bacterium Athens1014_28]
YSAVSFFVVAGTVKPIQVSPVELVDYLLGKTIYFPNCYCILPLVAGMILAATIKSYHLLFKG